MNRHLTLPRLALAALVVASIGCAAEQETKQEDTKSDEGAATFYAGGYVTSGATVMAPPPPPPPTAADLLLNKKVQAAWAFALGSGTDPVSQYPCANGATSISALSVLRSRTALSHWQTGAVTYTDTNVHACQVRQVGAGSIANINVQISRLVCSLQNDRAPWNEGGDASTIYNSPNEVDACWPGSKKFWQAGSWIERTDTNDAIGITHWIDLDLQVDPEPAHLNGSLYANGSSASATYQTSNTATYGYQWPGSWAVGSVPAGAPCATYAATSGTLLTSIIMASGSYRKCQ